MYINRGVISCFLIIMVTPLSAEVLTYNVAALIEREARHWGVDAALVKAVVTVESGFSSVAKSPKGAMGLMQLMPDTARRFGVDDPWDPIQNVTGGVRYLRFLLDRFDGNLHFALAGYNAGENSVDRYAGIPPYPETQEYVGRVLNCLHTYESQATNLSTNLTRRSCAAIIFDPSIMKNRDQYLRPSFVVPNSRSLRTWGADVELPFLKMNADANCRRRSSCRFSQNDKQQLMEQRLRWREEARRKRSFMHSAGG